MKIKPLSMHVQLEIDEAKAGGLVMDSVNTAVEVGKVIALGDGVEAVYGIKVGDKVLYKAWACDICTMDGKKYYFIDMDTKGIKAIIK